MYSYTESQRYVSLLLLFDENENWNNEYTQDDII